MRLKRKTMAKKPAYRKARIVFSAEDKARIIAEFAAHGLCAHLFHSSTGSAYVSVCLPPDSGSVPFVGGDEVALIRLSGHHGRKFGDTTHNAIGDRDQCMAALRKWTEDICDEFGV